MSTKNTWYQSSNLSPMQLPLILQYTLLSSPILLRSVQGLAPPCSQTHIMPSQLKTSNLSPRLHSARVTSQFWVPVLTKRCCRNSSTRRSVLHRRHLPYPPRLRPTLAGRHAWNHHMVVPRLSLLDTV